MSVAAALVTLVDLPGQTAAAARRVADASTGLAVATFNGAPGHPVRLPRDQWAGAMTAAVGDSGARSFLSGREDVLYVEVSDVAEGHDLDVPSATPTSGQPR